MPIWNWTSDVPVTSSQMISASNYDTTMANYSEICVQSFASLSLPPAAGWWRGGPAAVIKKNWDEGYFRPQWIAACVFWGTWPCSAQKYCRLLQQMLCRAAEPLLNLWPMIHMCLVMRLCERLGACAFAAHTHLNHRYEEQQSTYTILQSKSAFFQ